MAKICQQTRLNSPSKRKQLHLCFQRNFPSAKLVDSVWTLWGKLKTKWRDFTAANTPSKKPSFEFDCSTVKSNNYNQIQGQSTLKRLFRLSGSHIFFVIKRLVVPCLWLSVNRRRSFIFSYSSQKTLNLSFCI